MITTKSEMTIRETEDRTISMTDMRIRWSNEASVYVPRDKTARRDLQAGQSVWIEERGVIEQIGAIEERGAIGAKGPHDPKENGPSEAKEIWKNDVRRRAALMRKLQQDLALLRLLLVLELWQTASDQKTEMIETTEMSRVDARNTMMSSRVDAGTVMIGRIRSTSSRDERTSSQR